MPIAECLGIAAIIIMVGAYALEAQHRHWIAVFSAGCVLAAVYALLIRSYPFMLAEGLWAVISFRRWQNAVNYS